MFSLFCLLGSSVILFYVIRFRVHFHVTYTPQSSRVTRRGKPGRRAEISSESTATTRPDNKFVPAASTRPERNSGPIACPATRPARQGETTPILDSVVWGDITSGLVYLGADQKKAKRAARKAMEEHPGATFDLLFSVALQEVRAA